MGSTATQYQNTIEEFISNASKWPLIQWLGLKPPEESGDSNAPGGKAADKSAAAEPNTLVPDDNLPLETIKQQKTFVNPLSLISGSTVQTLLIGVTSAVVGVLQQSVLVLVFLFFLLLSSVKRDHPIGGAWGAMEGRIRGYIVTMTALSGITGFLVGAVLWMFGVQAPVLFGMLTFLFNFIPNVGSFISILLTIPAVWLSPGLSISEKWMAVLIPAAIQFFIGTFIQPKMMGESMKLHPVVIVISLIFWGMLWGIVGAFLAVPITSVIRIACDRHPLTKPVADLMSGQLGAARRAGCRSHQRSCFLNRASLPTLLVGGAVYRNRARFTAYSAVAAFHRYLTNRPRNQGIRGSGHKLLARAYPRGMIMADSNRAAFAAQI